jgi:hypothetical protein
LTPLPLRKGGRQHAGRWPGVKEVALGSDERAMGDCETDAPARQAACTGGRPRTIDTREVLNTILYRNQGGYQWEMMPHDCLRKSTVKVSE